LGGTGKAEAAKLPGVGVLPKQRPRKRAAEKDRDVPRHFIRLGEVSDVKRRTAKAQIFLSAACMGSLAR
jgi:hypothetical protein